MLSNLVLAGVAFAAFAAAQQGPYTIEPSSVEYPLRQSWCRSQQSLCPQICGGQANPNTCDPNNLQWACVCTNGQQPNFTDYVNTIPYYTCAEWRIRCVANAPNDIATQSACLSVLCGAQTVGAVAVVTSVVSRTSAATSSAASSAAASVTSSASGVRSSLASAASSVASAASSVAGAASSAASAVVSPSAAANMLELGHSYGTGAVAVGLLALFGLAL